MPNYRVKLLLVLETGEEKRRSFYVNSPSVADATEDAEKQARQEFDVRSVYVIEVS
jgi:hypothetical protein